jgi:hypothetical protein
MKKICFDSSTFFYKDTIDMSNVKKEILEECRNVIKCANNQNSLLDAFRYDLKEKQNKNFLNDYKPSSYLDFISKSCINKCIKIYQEKNTSYNKINIESWINVVRAKNPIQPNFKKNELEFHRHTDISKKNNMFFPNFTFIYYIQMPDNLKNTDGVLFFEGENKKVYHYLPKENDLIIMEAHTAHVPAPAHNSTKDRIVLACNVGFENAKKQILF